MLKRLITCLLLCGHFLLLSQELSYNQYTVHDGLAQMQVEDLLMDSYGALWIATRGGVSRFNGYLLDSFEDLDVKPGFCSEILEDSNGQIIILGGDGVYVFDGKSFSFFKAPNNLRFNQMSYMTLDDDGHIWINAQNSIPIVFRDSIFYDVLDIHPKLKLDSVKQVYFHKQSKSLLISIFKKGIFRLVKDSLAPVFKTDKSILICSSGLKGCSPRNIFIREFSPLKSRFYSLDKDLSTIHHIDEYLGEITYMKEPLSKDFVFTDQSRENLFLIEKGDTVSRKLIGDLVTKFNFPGEAYVDDFGNVFIESDKGLVSINANRFEKLDNVKAQNVWSINQMGNGDMFFGGYGSGFKLYSKSGDEKKIELQNEDFCNERSLSVELKHIYMGSTKGLKDDLIIPTANALIRFANDEFTLFDYDKNCEGSLPSLFVFRDLKNRRLLSATCVGLRILDEDGELIRVIKEGLFKHRCLLTINQDNEENYWVGATGGIASYNFDTEEIKNYTQENGGFPYNGVVCTFIDYRGTLWAGSREGLTYLDKVKDKFIALKDFDGVEVASMINGDDNQIFLSTAGALIEADLESFYKDGKMLHKAYDKNNGLGIIGSGQNGFFKDNNGMIWCTSDTEVYRFDPKNLKSKNSIPVPNILLVNGQRLDNDSNSQAFQTQEDVNNLSVEFESIGLNASNNLTYSYMLEGYDDKWSDYTKYNNCTYNNLGSGNYIFKVKNNQSDQIAQQEVAIDIPLHKEPYFGGLAGLASISFLLLSILLGRNYRLAKKNNQLLKFQEAQLLSEKKTIVELHKMEVLNKELLEKQNKKLVFQKSELLGVNEKLKQDIVAIQLKQENGNQKLEIKTKGKVNLIPSKDLAYIHAEENGCRYFLKDKTSFWNDERLRLWEEKLDPVLFVRIHRSTLVQKEYISKISYDMLSLVDGTELKIGRKYKDNL